MKTQKRKNAKMGELRESVGSTYKVPDLEGFLEISTLTSTIKLLQKIRRDKLAQRRRKLK